MEIHILLYEAVHGHHGKDGYNNEEQAIKGFRDLEIYLYEHRSILKHHSLWYKSEEYGLRELIASYPTGPTVPDYIQLLFVNLLQKLIDSKIIDIKEVVDELLLRFEDVWLQYAYFILPQPEIVWYYIDLLKQTQFDTKVNQLNTLIRRYNCEPIRRNDVIPQFKANLVITRVLGSIDLNETNSKGETIFIELFKKHFDLWIYKILIEYGADPFIADNEGNTVLNYCEDYLTASFFKRLLKRRELYTVISTREKHPLHSIPSSIIHKKITPFLFSARKKHRHRTSKGHPVRSYGRVRKRWYYKSHRGFEPRISSLEGRRVNQLRQWPWTSNFLRSQGGTPTVGIEPTTSWLTAKRSANWAK